jgi:formyl-CoA transferase
VALVDVLTAKDATIAILAALAARRRTGRGSHVQVNLLSSLQGALANQGQAYLGAGIVPGRMGNEHPSIAPYQLVQCADGPLAIACGNDRQFARLTTELRIPALAQDPRFSTNTARVEHRDILIPLLERALAAAPVEEWQERLITAEVPAGRVAGIDESLDLAEHLGLEPTIDVHDATGRTVGRQVRHAATWDPPLATANAAPPRLGEHTDTVLAWLRETTDAPSPSSMVRAG